MTTKTTAFPTVRDCLGIRICLAMIAAVLSISTVFGGETPVSPAANHPTGDRRDLLDSPSSPYFCGNGICESYLGETPASCPDDCPTNAVIQNPRITEGLYTPYPAHGDLWWSTWADDGSPDGRLFMLWGDGCGIGYTFGEPDCDEWDWDSDITDTGIGSFTGQLPDIECVLSETVCDITRDIPDGISGEPHTGHDDKPAGLLAIDGVLYMTGHRSQKIPFIGYVAYSEDNGHTWQMGEGTPWTAVSENSERSYFRCLMLINMGRNYSLNTDGYVYGLGIGWSNDWDVRGGGRVYLARVPVTSIAQYSEYRYFSGMNGSTPLWSESESDAVPVEGLNAFTISSAMYHPGIGRYLFMTPLELFESPAPWGPWTCVGRLVGGGLDDSFYGAYATALIPKDTGSNSFYFASSGLEDYIGYRLQIANVEFDINPSAMNPPATVNRIPASPAGASPAETRPICSERTVIELHPDGGMTIQDAVDNIADGGTIFLWDGVFSGPGNREIDFRGKTITLQSKFGPQDCVIDCEQLGRGFHFQSGETNQAMLRGVTIRNGFTPTSGGGILCIFASPTIQQCRIEDCAAYYYSGGIELYESQSILDQVDVARCISGYNGGGVSMRSHSEVSVDQCRIHDNKTWWLGGGINTLVSSTSISSSEIIGNRAYQGAGAFNHVGCTLKYWNSWFQNNIAGKDGAGCFFYNPCWDICPENSLLVENCTFTNNRAGEFQPSAEGGAVFCNASCFTQIRNCIFWGNSAPLGPELAFDGWGIVRVDHCDLAGGVDDAVVTGAWDFMWGEGMMNLDPQFVQGSRGDYCLAHEDSGQATTSPCVNAGHDLAESICYSYEPTPLNYCLNLLTTRTDGFPDDEISDLGAHYIVHTPVPLPSLNQWGIALCLLLTTLGLLYKNR